MTRKQYQTPTTNIIKLQHAALLMTSGTEANRNGYGDANTQDWE